MRPCRSRFQDFYLSHHRYVRSMVCRILRNQSDIEDVVQETFLQAWRRLDTFDASRGDIRAWLTVIGRTRALDLLRREAARRRYETCAMPPHPHLTDRDGLDLACVAEASARLVVGLPSLPPVTRRILELTYLESLSQRQVAATLDLTLGVVKSRLNQGLRLLRARVQSPLPRFAPFSAAAADCERALTTDERPHRAGSAAPLRDLQVMIVDDHAGTRDVLECVLGRAGADVIGRESAEAAYRTLLTAWPDVLVTDLAMPGQDGYALIHRVSTLARRTKLRLRAIAFTALASEDERAKALQAGFQIHLSKPVHPAALVDAVRQLAGPA